MINPLKDKHNHSAHLENYLSFFVEDLNLCVKMVLFLTEKAATLWLAGRYCI